MYLALVLLSCVVSMSIKVAKTSEGFLFMYLLVYNQRFKKCTSKNVNLFTETRSDGFHYFFTHICTHFLISEI